MPAPRPADEVIEEPFDLNKVKKALEILASSLKNEEHANLYYAIQNTKLESSREYVVQMWCKSALDENELNKYKSQILVFLKNKLSYTRLKLEVMYKAQERAQLVYNPVDKYFRIAEKNPIVQDLKEYFGADLSY
ncbi:MAG: hypothetical protein KBT03_05950 [Bacteroidales bacterium]|nr:hypothetical protein [Candidatus Scybalousia scybalohippi]